MNQLRYFVDPFDVLFFRGNRLFGSAGSFGESLMPPWPSVIAGAMRSALLADRGYDPVEFARGEFVSDKELGTPDRPGSFTVTGFDVARQLADDRVETLHALPADLAVQDNSTGCNPPAIVRRLVPKAILGSIQSSAATSLHAVLATPQRGKAIRAKWLNSDGWHEHLRGGKICIRRHMVSTVDLWATEMRIGIALDSARRSATEGALFTSQAVATRKAEHSPIICEAASDSEPSNVGFLAAVAGAEIPETLTLRLGGDGRAATATRVPKKNLRNANNGRLHRAIVADGRCRIILTTPGLFSGGWKPTGVDGDSLSPRFDLHGVTGRLVCAAVPRSEVVSGFDLARWRPKSAKRIAPPGSVYWLDELESTEEDLCDLVDHGLWSAPVESDTRRAEGFNRFRFAKWCD